MQEASQTPHYFCPYCVESSQEEDNHTEEKPVIQEKYSTKQSKEKTIEVDVHNVNCSCGLLDRKPMLQCEKCSRSFHASCAGIKESELDRLVCFFCDNCSNKKDKTTIKSTTASKSKAASKPIQPVINEPSQEYFEEKPKKPVTKKTKKKAEKPVVQEKVASKKKKNDVVEKAVSHLSCSCGLPDRKPMLQCEKCSCSFHASCADISENELDRLVCFFCDNCSNKKDKTTIRSLSTTSSKFKPPTTTASKSKAASKPIQPVVTNPEVYCYCLRPDDHKPMMECEGCKEWYHYACIGMTEKKAKNIVSYYCSACEEKGLGKTKKRGKAPTTPRTVKAQKKKKKKPTTNSQSSQPVSQPVVQTLSQPLEGSQGPNRYSCVCGKPWADDDVFMIQCDTCEGWHHFACVGLDTTSASKIEHYACASCEESTGSQTTYKTEQQLQTELEMLAKVQSQFEKKPVPKKKLKKKVREDDYLEYSTLKENFDEEIIREEPATPVRKSNKVELSSKATPKLSAAKRNYFDRAQSTTDKERKKYAPVIDKALTLIRSFFDEYLINYSDVSIHPLFFSSAGNKTALEFFKPFLQSHRRIVFDGLNRPDQYVDDEQVENIDIVAAYNAYKLCGGSGVMLHLCEWLYAFARWKRNSDVTDQELEEDVTDPETQKRFGLAFRSLVVMGFVKMVPKKPMYVQKLIL
jgi:uncharacterized protein YlaI